MRQQRLRKCQDHTRHTPQRWLTLRKHQRNTKTFSHTESEIQSRLCQRKRGRGKSRGLSKSQNIRNHRKRTRLRFPMRERHSQRFRKRRRQQQPRRQSQSQTITRKRCCGMDIIQKQMLNHILRQRKTKSV